MSTKQKGFTLVELIVISPVLIVMVTVIVALLINLMSNNLISNADIDLARNTKSALSTIENDMNVTSNFLTTTESAFSDPYGADNSGSAWSFNGSGTNDRYLIGRTYATTTSTENPNKMPVYISQYGCDDAVMPSNPVLTTNTVFFVRNNNLYRRTLTDTTQSTCQSQSQRQSCPTGVGTRPAICMADDSLLLANVTSFNVQYFTNSSDTVPIDAYSSSNPNILQSAKSIDVSVSVQDTVAGETLSYSSTIRISRIN